MKLPSTCAAQHHPPEECAVKYRLRLPSYNAMPQDPVEFVLRKTPTGLGADPADILNIVAFHLAEFGDDDELSAAIGGIVQLLKTEE